MKQIIKTIKKITGILLAAAVLAAGVPAVQARAASDSAKVTEVLTFREDGDLSMNVGETKKLVFIGTDEEGADYDCTDGFKWSSTNNRVLNVKLSEDGGRAHVEVEAVGSGTAKIVGRKGYYDTTSVLVTVKYIPLDMTVIARKTNVENAAKGCMLLGIRGTYESAAKKKILARINEIRYEACEKGYPSPVKNNRKLTLDDYVPIKWSSDLEWIAQIRAAESTVRHSHTRPNGRDSVSVTHNGIVAWGGCLAWNSSGIMHGIEQWYEEKNDWVKQNQNKGKVVGHYTALISPRNTHVGISGFYQSPGDYGVAAEFTSQASVLDDVLDTVREFQGGNNYTDWDDSDWEGMFIPDRPDGLDSLDDLYRLYGVKSMEELRELKRRSKTLSLPEQQSALKGRVIQAMEVRTSSLGKANLNAPTSIKKGRNEQLFVTREIRFSGSGLSKGIILDTKWKSSNPSVLSIKNDGTIRAKKIGKATVTAKFGGKTLKKTIKITKQ